MKILYTPDNFEYFHLPILQTAIDNEFIVHIRYSNKQDIDAIITNLPVNALKNIAIPYHLCDDYQKNIFSILHFKEQIRMSTTMLPKTLLQLKKQNKYLSTSIHQLQNIDEDLSLFDYCVYGPIFKSFSKNNYAPAISLTKIKQQIQEFKSKYINTKLIAVGGIDNNSMNKALDVGFDGVAFLGYVWQDKQPISKILEITDGITS